MSDPRRTLSDTEATAPARPRLVAAADARAVDELGILARIITTQGEIAAAALEPQAVVDVVIARAQELTGSSGAVVELLDGEDMFYLAASGTAAGHVGLRLRAAGSLSGLCVRTGEVLRCDDSELDARVDREACRRVGLRSMVVVPLAHRGTTIGVLKVLSVKPGSYGPTDVRILELMATLVGATLAHAVEYSAMADELRARTDQEQRDEEERAAITHRIERVFANDEMHMVFQPIVDLSSRRIVGHEALARFRGDPFQTPDVWFAAAWEVGMGAELESLAIRSALSVLDRLPQGTYLSLNASPALLSGDLVDLLAPYPADRIVVEITEHVEVEDYDPLEDRLASLRARGTRLAIDDAGAGYASLRHVLRLEPEIIKLDTSLTSGIDQRPRLQTMAAALVTFAAKTCGDVVAEGIETLDELETLRSLGIGFGQGYYLGRPAPFASSGAPII